MKKKFLTLFSLLLVFCLILPYTPATLTASAAQANVSAGGITFNGLTRLYTNFYNGVNGLVYDPQKAITTNPTIRAGYFATFSVTLYDIDTNGIDPKDYALSLLKINNNSNEYHALGSFAYTKIANEHAKSNVTVTRTDNTGNGAGAKGTFNVTFENLQYTGYGNMLSIPIYDKDGNLVERKTVEVDGTYSKIDVPDPNTPVPDDNTVKIAPENPYVIIYSYGLGKQNIQAGDTFALTVMFKNTSDLTDITNMLLTIKPSEYLMLTNSSNTIHIPSLRAQDVVTKIINVTAKPTAPSSSHTIDISMDYQYIANTERKSIQRSDIISIPVMQGDRLELTSVDVPQTVDPGDEISVTLNYMNKGRSELYNLSAEISGDFDKNGQKINIGNLAPGAKGSVDFFVKSTKEIEDITGTVTINYEDANAVQRKQSLVFSTKMNINDIPPGLPDNIPTDLPANLLNGGATGMPNMPAMDTNVASIVSTVVSAFIVAAIGFFIYKRIRRRRREWEDANL